MAKYRWYEKIFFRLQLREKKYYRLIFYLVTLIFIVQFLLCFPEIRQFLVLGERLEGEPIRILRKF
jgi:hypothetical protein